MSFPKLLRNCFPFSVRLFHITQPEHVHARDSQNASACLEVEKTLSTFFLTQHVYSIVPIQILRSLPYMHRCASSSTSPRSLHTFTYSSTHQLDGGVRASSTGTVGSNFFSSLVDRTFSERRCTREMEPARGHRIARGWNVGRPNALQTCDVIRREAIPPRLPPEFLQPAILVHVKTTKN